MVALPAPLGYIITWLHRTPVQITEKLGTETRETNTIVFAVKLFFAKMKIVFLFHKYAPVLSIYLHMVFFTPTASTDRYSNHMKVWKLTTTDFERQYIHLQTTAPYPK